MRKQEHLITEDSPAQVFTWQLAEMEDTLEIRAKSDDGTIVDPSNERTTTSRPMCQEARQAEDAQHQKQLLAQSVRDCEMVRGLATELGTERDLLGTIMEHTHAQIAYLDREFNIRRVNAAFAQSSGYSIEALLESNYFDLFPDEETEVIFRRVRDAGETASFQAKPLVFRDDGQEGVRRWDWTLAQVKDVDGETQGLVLSRVDVTERERARHVREVHMARMGMLLAISQQVLAETTAEGILSRVAEAACELTGARLGLSSHIGYGSAYVAGSSTSIETASRLAGRAVEGQPAQVYLELFESRESVRMTTRELRLHPVWKRLPEGHPLLKGLLGVPITGHDGRANGIVVVSSKEEGEFTAEDEVLLGQLAALTSLALQHVAAREEAERRASELDTVFEAIADGIILYDANGAIVRANAAVSSFCGVDPVGRDRTELARQLQIQYTDGHPVPFDEFPATLALRGEQVREREFHLTNGRGERRAVMASAAPLLVDGVVTGAVAVWHDVTNRKKAEERIRRYAERLRILHETDKAIVSSRLAEEVAQAVLRQLPQLLPCQRASIVLVGQEAQELSLLASYVRGGVTLEKGWRSPIETEWAWVIEKLARGQEHVLEDVQVLLPLSPWIAQLQREGVRAVVWEPLIAQGKLVGSLSVEFDVPGPLSVEQMEIVRELAEPLAIGVEQTHLYEKVQRYAGEQEQLVQQRTAALEASEARFRAIFEEAAIGIALVDWEARLTSPNPALQRMLGYSEQEMEGMPVLDLVAPDGKPCDPGVCWELASGQREEYRVKQRYLRKDGQTVDANVTVSPIRQGPDRASFAVAMVEDITERKRAQEALFRSEQLAITGRLAASIAHEVNNPLQSVTGSLELAREIMEEGEDPRALMEVAQEELERASRIVRQMRDLNRRTEAKPELADTNALLDKVWLLTRKQAQTRRVEVSWEPGDDLPVVPMIVDRIQQVFLNLVLNAIDAMPSGGQLRIRTVRTEEPLGVQIAFADTGVGIPPEELAHLFEPFHSTKQHGLGLGLYVSQSIIREHGGRVNVESEAGTGTTFSVWLPA